MTVHFIGAGPGAADLITVRGMRLLQNCTVCLYAGSLVPEELLAYCPEHAQRINTAPMSLDDIIEAIAAAHARGQDVVRLHSGDLSVWSALAEQLRRLRALGIDFTLTPGVPAFAAAAAALQVELTVPELAQSLILTRTSGRASPMPERETLANFAYTGATLALHLSIHNAQRAQDELLPHYGAECPCAIVWRASWPDERIVRVPLAELAAAAAAHSVQRTAVIFVGHALDIQGTAHVANPLREEGRTYESRLYAADYDRRYRPTGAAPRFADTIHAERFNTATDALR